MPMYARPDSPPPRAPSPVLTHIPLPSPPPRNRGRVASARSLKPRGHSRSPGLHQLITARSCDHMSNSQNDICDRDSEELARTRNRSTLTLPSLTLSHSLSIPASSHPTEFKPRHRRSLSFAIPYRSPPLNPTVASPPPPVPPMPEFMLSSPKVKPVSAYPATLTITPIYLPDIDEFSPISETPTLVSNSLETKALHYSQQKRRGVGMTCLKFFALRNSRSSRNAAVWCQEARARKPRSTGLRLYSKTWFSLPHSHSFILFPFIKPSFYSLANP